MRNERETLDGRYVWHLGCGDRKVPAVRNVLLSFEGIGLRDPYVVPTVFFESLKLHWAYSSVGLEHTPDKREVGSSNLPRPTNQVVGERWKVTGGKPAPTPVT